MTIEFINVEEVCKDLMKEYKKKITKDDLKDLDILTMRDGDRCVLVGDYLADIDDGCSSCNLHEYDEDLIEKRGYNRYDIMKVERMTTVSDFPNGMVIFEREEEVEEMTMAELYEALGKKIKELEGNK